MEPGQEQTQETKPDAVDAQLSLTLTADQLAAHLTITPAEGGGARISKEAVLAALASRGVIIGIDLDAINAAIAAGRADALEIARGRDPVQGADAWFECLLPEPRDRRPQLDASGHVDYRDLGEIQVVKEGTALMRRHPPTPGEPGVTVTGGTVAARPGKDAQFARGLSGVMLDPVNANCLRAALSGQPVQVKNGMSVEAVYSVDAVNMSTGNIRFDGSVKIRGDVSAGMTVIASGDIEVGGVAEAATLEAGGSIVIRGGAMGALGRKEGGEHHIRCGGSLSAAYAQQLRAEAGDSIFIDDMAMQCELSASNHIRVGQKRRGQVIGGQLQAMLSIHAKVLGGPNRIATRLEVGVSPELHRQQKALARERDGLESKLLEVSRLIDFAGKHPDRVPDDTLERARATARVLSDQIAELREQEGALVHKTLIASHAVVSADRLVHEGVVVTMGSQRFKVRGELQGKVLIGLGPDGLGVLASG